MTFRTFLWLVLLCLAAMPVQAETVVYVHTDALGSPVLETDDHANIIRQVDYRAYGEEVMDGPKTGPGYTGHYRDVATDLVYMQQRYYDQAVGRFLSVDPIATDTQTGSSFNRYAYTDNNPYSYIDPDGQKKAAVWVVHLVRGGLKKGREVSIEAAVAIRRAGGNILANRERIASQIERAAFPKFARKRDKGHMLKDGSGERGLPHHQTEGKIGHSFYGAVGQITAAAFSLELALQKESPKLNKTLDDIENVVSQMPDPISDGADALNRSFRFNGKGVVDIAVDALIERKDEKPDDQRID